MRLSLSVHQTGHFHGISAILGNFQIPQQGGISDGVFSVAAADTLNRIFQGLPGLMSAVVIEHTKLVGESLRGQIGRPNTYRTDTG